MTNAGQCGEEKVRHGGKDRTDGHRLENSQTHRHDAAHESTRERHHDAEHLGDRRDLLLGEARVRIEGVGHHAHDDVGDAVGGDQQQNARRPPAEAHEEVERLDGRADGVVQLVGARLLAPERPGPVPLHRRAPMNLMPLGRHASRRATMSLE